MNEFAFVLVAFAIVAMNAFFVATEFAIVRVRETRVDELVARGVKRAVATKDVLTNLNAYLSACQLGITLTSLGLGWIGEPAFAHLIEPVFLKIGIGSPVAIHSAALALAFVVITFLHVVLGELVPKTIAIDHAEGTALLVALPIRLFRRALYPLIWALNGAANLIVRAIGLRAVPDETSGHSEEELRMILGLSTKSGVLSASHAELLENALDFANRSVRKIMVPRADIFFLDTNRSYDENVLIARRGGHTRYPLCEDGDVDRMVGIVHIKDLFLSPKAAGAAGDLRTVARDPLFVPDSSEIDQLLSTFQKQHLHLAVVVDEYGGTSGIVTLEDVLEQLIGEIQDEFDEEGPSVHPLGDGRLSVDAGLAVDELEDEMGFASEQEAEVDTLGGLVLLKLGRIARVGDSVEVGGRRIDVTRVKGRRIMRVTVHPPETKPAQTPGA